MGDGANVFNTFSFNKWADGKREEEIDKESRRRRAEQIKRLKERLRKERALREAQGDGDLDLDALIEAIQQGEMINMPQQTEVTVIPEEPSKRKRGVPDEFSDDYIFNEINLYATRAHGLNTNAEPVGSFDSPPANFQKLDPLSWKYNRRNQNNEMVNNEEGEKRKSNTNNFKFNRMIHEIPK